MKYAAVLSSILVFNSSVLPATAELMIVEKSAVEKSVKKSAAPATASTADIPEEILRSEIITGARSPIDNKPMNATEYTQLQTQIETLNQTPPKVSDKVRNTIALLKLRKFIKTVLPFIPIK